MKAALRLALATLVCLGLASAAGAALTVNVFEEAGTTQSIDALTGFMTTGGDMAGMTVTAYFDDGLIDSGLWMVSGDSGSATGTGGSFVLSQSGDTFFDNPWTLTNTRDPDIGQGAVGLSRLVINGFPGATVFDRTTLDDDGTPGSAAGRDFELLPFDISGFDTEVTATYINLVALGAADPVGDIFQILEIQIAIEGFGATTGLFPGDPPFQFYADTDNISLAPSVAEPGTLLLLGAGFVALWARRRRG